MRVAFYLAHLAFYSLAAKPTRAAYRLDTKYDASNFFSSFDFFSGPDPTNGYVQYVDYETAFREGLAKYVDGAIFMGVDHSTYNPIEGRKSVRLTSQESFTRGLILADISHMPGGVCGVWPAFWMFGPNWPSSGEIDIIEGVNDQKTNTITLHTSPGCHVTISGGENYSQTLRSDCSNAFVGCGMQTMNSHNYGDGFNDINGGVYAMEWTSECISVWFFPRFGIPSDLRSQSPNPLNWGDPLVQFTGGNGCSMDSHFVKNKIAFDTTFCGDWAGNPVVWDSNPRCGMSGLSCRGYVANNPLDFSNTYWLVNSIEVYKKIVGRPTAGLISSSKSVPWQQTKSASSPKTKTTLGPWSIRTSPT